MTENECDSDVISTPVQVTEACVPNAHFVIQEGVILTSNQYTLQVTESERDNDVVSIPVQIS